MQETIQLRHQLFLCWGIGVVVAFLLVPAPSRAIGKNSKIDVSEETTFITEPLNEEGLPDFRKYLLQKGLEGVTTESNSAVLLWKALWPSEIGSNPEYWMPLCEALGIEAIPEKADSLITVYDDRVRGQVALELAEVYSAQDAREDYFAEDWQKQLQEVTAELAIEMAMRTPWTSDDLRSLDAWVRANQEQFDLVVKASQRPNYYSPPPNQLVDSQEGLAYALLPMTQTVRSAVRSLRARAMWQLGNGRITESWQDTRACYRLANHISQSQYMIDLLVGIALERWADNLAVTLLYDEDCTLELAKEIAIFLNDLPNLPSIAEVTNGAERLMFIDSCIGLATGRETAEESLGVDLLLIQVDWNFVLRENNNVFDDIVECYRLTDRQKRKKQVAQIEQRLEKRFSRSGTINEAVLRLFSSQARTRLVSDLLFAQYFPAMEAAIYAEEQHLTGRRLTRLAAALAIYQKLHGSYPENLGQLDKHVKPKQLVDLFSGEYYKYFRKEDGGYLLYSVSENQVNDNGTDVMGHIIGGEWVEVEPQEVDHNASDLVIRVPTPRFKLPPPPQKPLE